MLNPNDRYQSCDEILRVLLASGNSNPMPPWLEAKIKEYAADGVITRNERAVLDKEIAKAGVDRDLAEAIISDEIEKAISRKRKEELDRRNRMSQTSTKLEDEGGGGRKFVKILILLIVLAAVGTVLYMYYDKGHWPWEQPTTSQQGNSNDNYFAPGQIVYTTTNVNLRMLADKDSKLLMTVAKNKPVEVVSDGYFWVEVRVDNKRGYMAKQYLSHTQTK
jgi:uncharacterized protein YgiM (DUF1202 family)